jgi:hypothetical protein
MKGGTIMGVTVKGLKVASNKGVRFAQGMTVAQALAEAKQSAGVGSTVTVYQMEGRRVANERRVPLDELQTALVADNETVVVTPPVDNG